MFRKKMSMLSKDTEGIRGKKKTKIKHLKTTISETKITLDGINSRLDTEEEMVSKYEDRPGCPAAGGNRGPAAPGAGLLAGGVSHGSLRLCVSSSLFFFGGVPSFSLLFHLA